MQSCLEFHHSNVTFRRYSPSSPLQHPVKEEDNLHEPHLDSCAVSSSCSGGVTPSSSRSSGSFYGAPHCYVPGKKVDSINSLPRLGMLGGQHSMYPKAALVWSPTSETHGSKPGSLATAATQSPGRPVSPASSGVIQWMSMMADHAHSSVASHHDVHYMWNGVETKMNSSDQHNASPLQKGEYQNQWASRTDKKSLGPGSSGDEGRPGGLDASQMHMYGNRTGGSSTSPPVSTSNSALLVVPQPINAATKPPSLTATNCTGRKYQCKMCPQIFMHKSAMQHHSREIHRGEIKPHQCQQCLKSFSSNHQLTQHIRIHTGEKPYKCSYCDRRFKQLSHVQQHTRLHTGERPYKCHLTNCGRAFIQLSNLQQHLRNHDNQMERAKNRPYLCNICGKGFASESSLRTHRSKQHAALIGGANSQSCPVCHKICLNGDALMEHMRTTHKDPNASGTPSKRRTTSHPCPICAKTYVNEGSLRKHLASHSESASTSSQLRMWPCTVCQSVFSNEAGLLHHMESMRMEPKHQFAAQYILSRAAAEKREKAASVGIPSMSGSAMNITSESTSPSNTSSMDYQEQVASTSSHQSTIPSASCSHSLQLAGEETQHQFTTQYVLSHATEKSEKTPAIGMPNIPGSTISVASGSTSPSTTSSVDYQDPIASTSSHQSMISSASCSHSLQLPGQGTQ